MSGTQDEILAADFSENLQSGQAGLDQSLQEVSETEQEKITPAQKMDNLLRKNTSSQLKKEVEKLRKESARYRQASKKEFEQKTELLKKSEEISRELEALRVSNRTLKVLRALDNAGCIKSDLVAKDIPEDCEDLDSFINNYKESNGFLFKPKKTFVGNSFKASGSKNLTPSQQMDAFIRAALGR